MQTELEELIAKRDETVRDMRALVGIGPIQNEAVIATLWLLDEAQDVLAAQIHELGGTIEDSDTFSPHAAT
jgi:hypothetical protein